MAEDHPTCPFHHTETYRTEQLEKKVDEMDKCMSDYKKDVQDIKTSQAVMQQKFDNLRYPIWIIFLAVLAQIAKWVASFSPLVQVAGGM